MSGIQPWLAENGTVFFWGILAYLTVISLLSVIVTIADKRLAKKAGHRRVPESTLLLYAAFGGAAAMLTAMLLVRHKTRHVKFMLGLPLILLFQAVTVLWLVTRFL